MGRKELEELEEVLVEETASAKADDRTIKATGGVGRQGLVSSSSGNQVARSGGLVRIQCGVGWHRMRVVTGIPRLAFRLAIEPTGEVGQERREDGVSSHNL